ncbi:MAG: hypothetical protein ABL921_18960 [Pirellula sp.]
MSQSQKLFDFSRGDQLGLLDAIEIPDAREISGATAKSVLRAIDGFGARCFAASATIAATVHRSVRTVKRALSRLEALGLVVPDDRKRRFNANLSATVCRRIDWTEVELQVRRQQRQGTSSPSTVSASSHGVSPKAAVSTSSHDNRVGASADISAGPVPAIAAAHGAMVSAHGAAHGAMVSAHGAMVSTHGAMVSAHGAMVAPNPYITERTAPNRLSREPEQAAADSLDWDLVSERLSRLGVDRTTSAIRAARDRGLDCSQVLSILDEFERHRTRFRSAGAILDRIKHGAWCAKIPTGAEVESAKSKSEERNATRLRARIEYELSREWRQKKIYHTKSNAEINAEIDRRLRAMEKAK